MGLYEKRIKNITTFTIVLAIGLAIIGCNDKPTLNIYNYGDYIAPEVIKDFERRV